MSEKPICAVEGCGKPAYVEVFLYDFISTTIEVFCQRDETCGFLCEQHLEENEASAEINPKDIGFRSKPGTIEDLHFPEGRPKKGIRSIKEVVDEVRSDMEVGKGPVPTSLRRYRIMTFYKYTNQYAAKGFSVYRPIPGYESPEEE